MIGIAGCCARAASGQAAAVAPIAKMNSRRFIAVPRLEPYPGACMSLRKTTVMPTRPTATVRGGPRRVTLADAGGSS